VGYKRMRRLIAAAFEDVSCERQGPEGKREAGLPS
jgi:hypothetical protein